MEPSINTPNESGLPGVLRAGSESAIVEVTAPWCGAGHLLSPIVSRALGRVGGRLSHLLVNAEQHPELRHAYGVHKLPTLLFIRNGELVGSATGTIREDDLIARINELYEFTTDHETTTGGCHE